MKKKDSGFTVTDQFCGAGGNSQGFRKAGQKIKGVQIKIALNHWKLAIETHNTNFPDTFHECTDVSACDPRRYPSTDVLVTSPECTNHSLAKGKKAVKAQIDLFNSGKLDASAERSRATMWDVVRFAEYHNYPVVIVENVVDARKWIHFDTWLKAMHNMDYLHKCLYFNSMHFHPTPQSRDRLFVVFWKKGNKAPDLNHMPQGYCNKCNKNVFAMQTWKNSSKMFGKYKQSYLYHCPECTLPVEPYYYAAANAIDWSDVGQRIGDRAKPLSDNTQKRIKYGLDKYGRDPFFFHAAYSEEARGVVRGVDQPMFTQSTLMSQALIVNDQHSTGTGFRVKSATERFDTVPSAHSMKLVLPFIIKGEHTLAEGYAKDVSEAFQTQTVRQSMALISPPQIVEFNRTGTCRDATEALSTVLTSGSHHGIVTNDTTKCFLSYFYGNHQASGINETMGTLRTKEHVSIVQYTKPEIEDCYFRMIKASEIKKAMAFDDDYVILGTQKDQVKQCGNAVTPPVMQFIAERVMQSLNG